jgi:molybdopterin converting factor small subunit
MKVQVHFFGNFRSITKRSGQTIELPESATVRDLLDYLMDQYIKMVPVLSPEYLQKSHVLVVLNEAPARKMDLTLKENDQLYLFIILSGG